MILRHMTRQNVYIHPGTLGTNDLTNTKTNRAAKNPLTIFRDPHNM